MCKMDIRVGIYCALKTCVRFLNQHPHIHVFIIRRDIDVKYFVWRNLILKNSRSKESGTVPSSASYNHVNPDCSGTLILAT